MLVGVLFRVACATLAGVAASDPSRTRTQGFHATNVLSLLVLIVAIATLLLSIWVWTLALVSRPVSPDARGYALLYMPFGILTGGALASAAVLPKATFYGRRVVRIVLTVVGVGVLAIWYAAYLHWRMTGT
jgi:hypothetical protein